MMTNDQLIERARARISLDVFVSINGLRERRTILPLYEVIPDAKHPEQRPWIVCIAWGGGDGPRFLNITGADVMPLGELPDIDVKDMIDLPWWCDPTSVEYRANRQMRASGEDGLIVWVGRTPLMQISFLEAVAMAAQLGLTIAFNYAKPGKADEARHLDARWVGGKAGNLLGGDDLDRPSKDDSRRGAPRSFRVDRIKGLELDCETMPTWVDGWTLPTRGE